MNAGYYWIKPKGHPWQIGLWQPDLDWWSVIDNERPFFQEELEDVDPHPIPKRY